MKKQIGTAVILAALALAQAQAGETFTDRLEQDIILKIRTKTGPVYHKYIGVDCIRKIVSRQYDSRDNSYRGGYTVFVRRQEYFYKKATYKVLKYLKDGKEEPSWKYNYPTRNPAYQPFAPDTDKHYDLRIRGKKTITGIPCWEFEAIPKKKTPRHIRGFVYFSIRGLDLIYLEGTIAAYPFGLQSLSMKVYFKKLEDAYVMSHGSYTFVVHVPIFYPHRKFEQTFTSVDDRLIPAKP